MKKKCSLLILAALLLASCGGTDTPGAQTDAPGSTAQETEPAVTERVPAPTDLPEVDYSGETFTIWMRSTAVSYAVTDVISEGTDGEIINDSVYDRNTRLEDRFGITLEGVAKDTPSADAKREIMSGSDTFDIITDCMTELNGMASESYLVDWYSLPHFDPSDAWWDENAAENLSLGGKLYMMVSDVSMNASSRARFLYINKKIASDYDIELPYDLVREGKWTWDKFTEMVNTVSSDLNGDGVMDGNDLWGMLIESPDYFLTGCGVLFTEKNADDVPEMALVTERNSSVIEAVGGFWNDKKCVIDYDRATKDVPLGSFAHIFDLGRSMFAADHFLFLQNGANVAYQFSNMNSEYGILPNPKFDETQAEYHHLMDPLACAWSIPITNGNPEMADIIMNWWGYLSSNTLVDAFYEATIKYKRLNAPEDAEMLDIIRSSIRYEFSSVASIGVVDVARDAVKKGNLASVYEKKSKSIEKKLERLLDAYLNE